MHLWFIAVVISCLVFRLTTSEERKCRFDEDCPMKYACVVVDPDPLLCSCRQLFGDNRQTSCEEAHNVSEEVKKAAGLPSVAFLFLITIVCLVSTILQCFWLLCGLNYFLVQYRVRKEKPQQTNTPRA